MNANAEPNEPPGDADEQLLDLLQASVYPFCDRYMLLQIVRYCRALGLDPTLRPVHVLPLRDKEGGFGSEAIVPGIGAYRAIAARCGCAGIDEPQFGPEVTEQCGAYRVTYPSWCRVTVRRRLAPGEVACFTAREFWSENVAFEADSAAEAAVPNDMWRRRPFGQLAKCAEAQALRRAFPEVGAQPVLEELTGTYLGASGPAGAGGAQRCASSARPPVAMPQPRGPREDIQEREKAGEQVPLVLEPVEGRTDPGPAASAPGPRKKRPARSRSSDETPGDTEDRRRRTTAAAHPPGPLEPSEPVEAASAGQPAAQASPTTGQADPASAAAPSAKPQSLGHAGDIGHLERLENLADAGAAESLAASELADRRAPDSPCAAAAAANRVGTCVAVPASRDLGDSWELTGPAGTADLAVSKTSADRPTPSPTRAAAALARVGHPAATIAIRLPGGAEADERAITAGERDCLQRRLRAKGWSIAAARQAAGLQPREGLDDLTRRGVAALLAVTA